MIAVKHRGSLCSTMQLKISEKSLHSLGSDSSFSSTKADTICVHEKGQMRPLTSPSLRKLSTASFSVDTQSMQGDEPPLRPTIPSFPCLPGFIGKHELELHTLIQYIVLLAVASQLGDILDEIIEIVELHLHSFPVLVVLGVLPKIFLKKENVRMADSVSSNHQRNSSLLSASSASILRDIEKYYAKNNGDAQCQNLEIRSPPELRSVVTTHHQGDEWGHFADFDDGIDLGEESFCLQPDKGSRAILSPLHETENDE